MLALSMKQKRYSTKTVGMIAKSIFLRSFASATGSNWMRELPYLHKSQHEASVGESLEAVNILVSSCMTALSNLMGRFSGDFLVHGGVSFFLEVLGSPHVRNDARVKLQLLSTWQTICARR
jgi:hypothetical protein